MPEPALRPDHIVDLFCWIDDALPRRKRRGTGRPAALSDAELITILVWNTLSARSATLKDAYRCASLDHARDFPGLPSYQAFVARCHRVLPQMEHLVSLLLCTAAPVRLLDSTMLPVCAIGRAGAHRVAKGAAAFGKNWQGWHFGFKLHASVDLRGRLCRIAFTPANAHDAQVMPELVDASTRIAVGDTLYGARVMGRSVYERYGTVVVAPPHPKQTKKLLAAWQLSLLDLRSGIESVFDVLKEHLHIVSSFPRSAAGYFLHYLRILLGYQVGKCLQGVS